MRRSLVWFAAALTGCAASGSREPGQAPHQPAATGADGSIPADVNVLHGTLENGLAYYFRRGTPPAGAGGGRYLGLIVKVGWGDEADGQRGLGHLVEHVAFGGTRR